MKRDGNCNSLWQNTTKEYHSQKTIEPNQQFDVIIAGGGITGITTGLMLQKAGKSVLIAEAHTLGFGTTGGTTAHLNTFMDTPYNIIQKKFGENSAQLTAKAIKQALDLIRRNIKDYNIDCDYKELAAYLFAQDEKQDKELEEIVKATKECTVSASFAEMNFPVPCTTSAIFQGQATFHPTRYLMAMAEEFEKAGGTIMENCRVTKVEEGEPHVISTSYGIFRAIHFIYATHIPPGVNLLHFRCAPYRSYAIAVKLEKKKDYQDALYYDMYDPYHYYRSQEIDGDTYFIIGGEDHKTGHEENTEACFRRLEAHVRKYFPVEEVTNRWSSQYFEPTDGLPYIGDLPGHTNNMYVATGYGGNGMVYSAVAAITLTGIIAGGNSEYQDLFDPNRIKMVAGFSNFVKEAADVVGNFLGKLIPADKLEVLADLAPGEARIAKFENHRVAIYKDEKGEVHALNAACTHIKCEVAWNSAEKTWDCGCHGSRFSYTGEMLNAPARKNLEKVDDKFIDDRG